MATAHPEWINKADYERWAKEVLTPEKYAEVVKQYGEAPGEYMSGAKMANRLWHFLVCVLEM